MSVRRSSGDLVWKLPNAGFVGLPGNVVLSGEPEPCILECGDDECQEWPNAWSEEHGGFAYHVSECEVEDPRGASPDPCSPDEQRKA